MNDIAKDTIRRFLQRFGIRLIKESFYKHEYDKENYLELAKFPTPVILDVGANIGQSSIWFSKSFPNAQIHAFEPVPSVFKRLEKEVASHNRIEALNLACGKSRGTIRIPTISDDSVQTIQVLAKEFSREDGDEVTVTTVDDYCQEKQISSIQILKTDTEGYDLDVLEGASGMLEAGKVNYILSEATITESDSQHTQFFAINKALESFGYKVYSFYNVHHDPNNGRTDYFNALFCKG